MACESIAAAVVFTGHFFSVTLYRHCHNKEVHDYKVADAPSHDKEMEDLMGAEVFMF